MRNFILYILLVLPTLCFAGRSTLADGKTSIYWEDRTPPVAYNGYRVEVKLTDVYPQNVWGTVSLYANGKRVGLRNFMVKAGDLKCNVDFDGLADGTRYDVKVSLTGK